MNPPAPTMIEEQIAAIEANLARLSQMMPALPKSEVLLARLVLFLAHDIGMMLEHQIRPHGLGEGEFRVLTALFSQPHSTAHPGDLCARAAQSPANMSRITDALVGRGLITRVQSAEDRRRLVLRITDKGASVVQNLLPALFGPMRQLCGALSAREQKRMIADLKQCIVRLDAATAAARAGRQP